MKTFNLDDLIARSIPVQFKGREYRFSELTQGDLGQIQNMMRSVLENPLTKAKEACKELPPNVAAAVWKEASRQWAFGTPALHTEEGLQAVLSSSAVKTEIVYFALKRDQPELTRETAKDLVDSIPFDPLLKLILFALMGEEPDDPKAGLTTPESTGNSSSDSA